MKYLVLILSLTLLLFGNLALGRRARRVAARLRYHQG